MEIIVPNSKADDVPPYFLSGKFSDFSLRHGLYSFQVHKIVISSNSKYFDAVCGDGFLEGSRSYVELDEEEDPVMLARMLIVMYSGDYGTESTAELLPTMMQNALRENTWVSVNRHTITSPSYKTHALLYAMGDRYQFPALVGLARAKFIAAIADDDFGIEDLVAAIDVVYNTTPDCDDGLRKHVVFAAQKQISQLKQLASFKSIFEKYIGFSWDFGLEYKARKTVWCIGCRSESKLPLSCAFGFHGLCGNVKSCNELEWASLKCSACKRVGQLIRDEPCEEDEVRITSIVKSASLSGIQASSSTHKRKKRKSM